MKPSNLRDLSALCHTHTIAVNNQQCMSQEIPVHASFVALYAPIKNAKEEGHLMNILSDLTKNFDLYFFIEMNCDFSSYYKWLVDDEEPKLEKIWAVIKAQASSPVPSFSSMANALIKGYYIGARKIHRQNTPLWTLHSLVRLASCHARLCGQNRVCVPNALVAIEIVEESIITFTGASTLGWRKANGNLAMYGKTVSNWCLVTFISSGRRTVQGILDALETVLLRVC
eukprot:TRINITY_DN6257_c0_g1_i4.p1 TRINITY_DN6257_c0_g1~~TRINITY_DN6257_c0_g1_i4.p1  ORF type:complete len:228 (-),score=15.41 TRINITY_DN6257_c0_g1_i4:40-723(-)